MLIIRPLHLPPDSAKCDGSLSRQESLHLLQYRPNTSSPNTDRCWPGWLHVDTPTGSLATRWMWLCHFCFDPHAAQMLLALHLLPKSLNSIQPRNKHNWTKLLMEDITILGLAYHKHLQFANKEDTTKIGEISQKLVPIEFRRPITQSTKIRGQTWTKSDQEKNLPGKIQRQL